MKLNICEDKKGLVLRLTAPFIEKYDIKDGIMISIVPIDKNNFRMTIDKKDFIVRKK